MVVRTVIALLATLAVPNPARFLDPDAQMKYWEIIADNLSASGWSWGCSSQIDSAGRVLFTADAHRDNGKSFIVPAEKTDMQRFGDLALQIDCRLPTMRGAFIELANR